MTRATRTTLLLAIAVAAATFAVFARAIGFEFVLWDDPQYIRDNPLVQPQIPWPPDGMFTPALGYPIPLTVALYRLVAVLAGVTPAAFHALNVALHAVNAVLFFFLLRRTASVRVAALGTALWALHPLVVEPVAWCTGTKDLLYAAGLLLTLHGALERSRVPPWLQLVAVAAALAKPTAVVLPVCLLWTAVALDGRAGWRRPGLAVSLVLTGVVALAIWGAASFLAQHAGPDGYRTVDASVVTAPQRLAAVLQALDLQVRHVVWPHGLLPQYFRLTDLQPTDAPVVRGLLAAALLAGVAVAQLRAPDRRLRWWVGLLAITYAPVSMLVPILRFTCDSYLYVPLLAVAALVALTLESALGDRRLQAAALLAALCLLGLTLAQQGLWRNSVTLWGGNWRADPHHGLVTKRYAEALDAAGDHAGAYALVRHSLAELKSERMVDGMVLAVVADRAPPAEARALYLWAYAHQPQLRADAHRNFCTFVARQRPELTAAERRNLAVALDALRRFHAKNREVEALLALGSLAGEQRVWPEAGALFEQAFALSGQPEAARAALLAYQSAGLPDAVARLQASLARLAPPP